jgi:hypothetical protein
MERFTLDFSIANFITIGLIAALWYLIFVGGFSVAFKTSNTPAAA